ncbi:MAG TPA: hypothetical protein VFE19_03160 [Jatrophihabitantaceae bacterium]|jgi:hypothetical protein|nr:hypothetical protein [Jatrophihabitantaceae bacterium]
MPISRRTATAAAAVLAVALTACSSDSNGAGSTELAKAMSSVNGAGAAKTEFQFGDMKRLRELGIADPKAKPVIDARWQLVVSYGAGRFTSLSIGLSKLIALDILATDTMVTIGTPPNTAVRISGGVEKTAVTAKLKALGAKPRTFGGTSGLSLAPDNAINRMPALANPGLLNDLNQVVVDDDSMTMSPNGATLQQALGNRSSLLDADGYRDLADCLGDVIGADIRPAPPSDRNAAVYAVGVRDPGTKAGPDREVVCVLPRKGNSGAVHAAFAKNLALSAPDPITRAPISQYLAKSKVGSIGEAVQAVLTAKSKTPIGYALGSLLRGALPVLDGSCQPKPTRRC